MFRPLQVMGEDHHKFEEILTGYKKSHGYIVDTDMNAEDWKVRYMACSQKEINSPTYVLNCFQMLLLRLSLRSTRKS